jgi:hypothetical protein
MSDRSFERAVHDWLEDGSDRTSRAAIDAVLLAVKTTPQEREPWIPRRFTTMPTYMRLAAAFAVVAVVGFGALISFGGRASVGATPTPSTSVSPSAMPTIRASAVPAAALVPFTSPIYGYTIGRPPMWAARVAGEVLTGTTPPWVDSAGVDQLQLKQDRYGSPEGIPLGTIVIGAARVEAATSSQEWAGVASSTCGHPSTVDDVDVDGETGQLLTIKSCFGEFHQWLVVVHEGWGYHIVWFNDPGTEAFDRAQFDEILSTFRFGVPSPPPSASPTAS